MKLRKLLTGFTGLAVAFALATALTLGAFATLPTPEAAASLSNFACQSPPPGYLFIHDAYNATDSLCYNGNGYDTNLRIYYKDGAENGNVGNANLCYSFGGCFFVGSGQSRYDLPVNELMTSISLGQ